MPERLTARHRTQLRLYARALSEHLGGEEVRAALVGVVAGEQERGE